MTNSALRFTTGPSVLGAHFVVLIKAKFANLSVKRKRKVLFNLKRSHQSIPQSIYGCDEKHWLFCVKKRGKPLRVA